MRETIVISAFTGCAEDLIILKKIIREQTSWNFSEAMRKIIKRAIKDKSWMEE